MSSVMAGSSRRDGEEDENCDSNDFSRFPSLVQRELVFIFIFIFRGVFFLFKFKSTLFVNEHFIFVMVTTIYMTGYYLNKTLCLS